MCLKRFKQLEQSVKELNDFVRNEQVRSLEKDSKDLKELRELLENIPINVKNVMRYLDQDTLEYKVKVSYEIPNVEIMFDENNEPIKNETFYALNASGLISLKDMQKIKKVLEEMKNERTQ